MQYGSYIKELKAYQRSICFDILQVKKLQGNEVPSILSSNL